MKIRNINFINNSPKTFENKKEQRCPYVQFNNFSKEYCNAIKSLNFSFKGKMSEAELKQKCDELKKQLMADRIIKNEDEISWYTDHYANEGNITIARKVFSSDYLKDCQRDILKTTNEENLPVANYICNNPFPLQYVFDILLASKKENVQASLALCQSEDIPKDIIASLLSKIKKYNNNAAAKIALDENYPKRDKVRSITLLNKHNSFFIEELLNDKYFPRDNMLFLLNNMQDKEETLAKQNTYKLLSKNPNNPRAEIETAISRIDVHNQDYFNTLYHYFINDGILDLKQINFAFNGTSSDYIAEEKIKTYEAVIAQENLPPDELCKIVKHSITSSTYAKQGLDFIKNHPDFPQELKVYFLSDISSLSIACGICERENYYKGIKEFYEVYKMLMANPELYINGEAKDKKEAQEEIKNFVEENFESLINLSSLYGKTAIEQVFRKRLDAVSDFLSNYDKLDYDYETILKQLLKCKKEDGSEFSINEKLNFLDISLGFNICNVEINKIKEKIKDGKVDLTELEKFLLKETFKYCGMSDSEIEKIPQEKLELWNLEFISCLAILENQMCDDEFDPSLGIIIKIANSDINFKDYIHQDDDYGAINQKTSKLFKKHGLNYDKWLNPPKTCETQFNYVDSNQAMLTQIAGQIEEDIEVLRKTPAKSFIDKHFSDCIVGSKFKINEKYTKNKQSLEAFTKNMFSLLDKNIFSRAQKSLDNPDKKKIAQLTLTIKNHLEQRIKDISQCETKAKEKTIDLTIKMWDRNPAYDIFQGNYSTCCIALNGENSSAMPHYLLNSAFNMIELIDNSTGETIGNALCYFALDELNEPMFVIDNIEIANKHKMSNKASDELLNEITGYCINLCREISNRNIKIVMGTSYNDVYDEELSTFKPLSANFLGKLDIEEIYIDAFGGWDSGKYNSNKVEDEEDKMELFYLADSQEENFFEDEDNIDWH